MVPFLAGAGSFWQVGQLRAGRRRWAAKAEPNPRYWLPNVTTKRLTRSNIGHDITPILCWQQQSGLIISKI